MSGADEFARLRAGLRLVDERTVLAWAVDPQRLQRRFVVEVLGDGASLAVRRADTFLSFLYAEGLGDGCFGLVLGLDDIAGIDRFELLLSNHERLLATLTRDAASGEQEAPVISAGSVMWRGGLRLSGALAWRRSEAALFPPLRIFEGSQALAASLRYLPGEDPHAASVQVDIHLPAELADGKAHRLRVLGPGDIELQGSPLTVYAHRGGFGALAREPRRRPGAGFDAETLAHLDSLIPASLPFEAYPRWARSYPYRPEAAGAEAPAGVFGVVVIGRAACEPTLASLGEQSGPFRLRAVVLDTAAGTPDFAAADWNAACASLALGPRDRLLVLRAGTTLRHDACLAVAAAMEQEVDGVRPGLCLADHELFGGDGAVVPLFGPVFDYERLLAQGYGEGLFALAAVPVFPPGERLSGYDVLLSGVEACAGTDAPVAQVPAILATVPRLDAAGAAPLLARAVEAHLARLGAEAAVEPGAGALLPLVHVRRRPPQGAVTIVIPTRDRLDLLEPCIRSVREKTEQADYRLLVVDNGSREAETLAYLTALEREGTTVLRDRRPFNYARLNNDAVAACDTPFICLLNNDVEIVAPGWLHAMQGHLARPDVGAVGAKLVWPNGMLQHGGVVLGLNFAAGHAYDRYLADEPGYADGVLAPRECGAVTAACLLLRRADFLAVGGFDEQAFPVAFNDVDLCLKLRRAGFHLVWSPDAVLLHHESASRSSDTVMASKRARADKELASLRARWAAELAADPCYNPNLNLDAYSFTGLACPPRDRRARYAPPPRL